MNLFELVKNFYLKEIVFYYRKKLNNDEKRQSDVVGPVISLPMVLLTKKN
jgi:hypothetical protein